MPSWPLWRQRKSAPTAAPAPTAESAQARAAQPAEALELRLLAGVRAGEPADFEALYRLYHPRLQRFIGQMTQHTELAEEVLDDTLMVVWQRADSFAGQSKLSTWIFGIAYRKTLKALSRLDLPEEEPNSDSLVNPDPDPEANPEQRLGRLQLQARMRQALASLSVDHRAVLQLCYFHDMGYGEIAQVVGCPQETVKTRVFYARRRLKSLLADFAGPASSTPGEQP